MTVQRRHQDPTAEIDLRILPQALRGFPSPRSAMIPSRISTHPLSMTADRAERIRRGPVSPRVRMRALTNSSAGMKVGIPDYQLRIGIGTSCSSAHRWAMS